MAPLAGEQRKVRELAFLNRTADKSYLLKVNVRTYPFDDRQAQPTA